MDGAQNFEITVWPRKTKRNYIYDYSARVNKKAGKANFYEGGGASISNLRAKKRAICEAVERFSGSKVSENLIRGPYEELVDSAVDPNKLILFKKSQYRMNFPYIPYNRSKRIEWVRGFSLTHDKEIFVPAFAVYLGYNRTVSYDRYFFPTLSCGLAVAENFDNAVIHGILELIERDAAMLAWMFCLSPLRLDLSSIKSKKLVKLIKNIETEGLCPVVSIVTGDIKIPTVIGIIYAKNQKFPYASFGLATEMNIEEAVLKSLEEALMIRSTIESMPAMKMDKHTFKYNMVKNFLDHALFYASPERKNLWQFLGKGKLVTTAEVRSIFDFKKSNVNLLSLLIDRLGKFNKEVVVVKLDNYLTDAMNLKAIRVIIPELQQMDFDYNARFLGGDRIKNMTKDSVRINKPNIAPHPFA